MLIHTLPNSCKDKGKDELVQPFFVKLKINAKKLFTKIILKDIYQKKKFEQEITSIHKLVQEKNFYKNSSERSFCKIFLSDKFCKLLNKINDFIFITYCCNFMKKCFSFKISGVDFCSRFYKNFDYFLIGRK